MAKSSRIIRVATADLPERLPNGFVTLGTQDGETWLHVAPQHDAVRVVNGTITDGVVSGERVLADGEQAPSDAPVLVVNGARAIPWPHVVVFDPTPAPFVWAEFSDVHPALAAKLMPHQWAGE